MRNPLWLLVLILILVSAWARSADVTRPLDKLQKQPALDIGIEGIWACEAKCGPDIMKGTATVSRVGGVYHVLWDFPGWKFGGLGVRKGNTFSVSWAVVAIDKETGTETQLQGLHVFEIDGAKLKGVWVMAPGNLKLQAEMWEYAGPLKREP